MARRAIHFCWTITCETAWVTKTTSIQTYFNVSCDTITCFCFCIVCSEGKNPAWKTGCYSWPWASTTFKIARPANWSYWISKLVWPTYAGASTQDCKVRRIAWETVNGAQSARSTILVARLTNPTVIKVPVLTKAFVVLEISESSVAWSAIGRKTKAGFAWSVTWVAGLRRLVKAVLAGTAWSSHLVCAIRFATEAIILQSPKTGFTRMMAKLANWVNQIIKIASDAFAIIGNQCSKLSGKASRTYRVCCAWHACADTWLANGTGSIIVVSDIAGTWFVSLEGS